jgi:hypothetical protein
VVKGFWASCDPLPMSFSQTPTPHSTFVENKSKSAIRKACQKAVEALFSRISHTQSRIFWLVAYSVFKDQPIDTLLSRGESAILPFVRFNVKEKLLRFRSKNGGSDLSRFRMNRPI